MSINRDLLAFEKKIFNISEPPLPTDTAKYKAWLSHRDFIAFIKKNVNEDDVILYLSVGDPGNHVFIYGVPVLNERLNPIDVDDLIEWSCNPTSEWGIRWSPGGKSAGEICSPFDFSSSKTLIYADQLIYLRSFEGRIHEKSYFDISEILLQPHGLHYVHEKSAYCCLDDEGNVQSIIKVMCNSSEDNQNKIVTINKNVLRKHLQITKCSLVRFFESRHIPGRFLDTTPKQRFIRSKKIYYKRAYFGETQSMIRGFQVIDDAAIKVTNANTKRKYEKFIAHDFRNGKVKKIPCDPKALASYFEVSRLPFEMSPAFFKPEVLVKYKSDSDKYSLTESSISCRGAWILECYHLNEAGQVFSYLIYLSRLPYKEQQYWASFNEQPRGGISRSAMLTDFYGQFDLSYEPISSMKMRIQKFSSMKLPWWQLKDRKALAQLHYPISESLKEWSDSIHTLNKIVNEGLVESFFKSQLIALKVDMSKADHKLWRSIRMLKEFLALKFPDLVDIIHDPLYELNEIRTLFHGHASGATAKKRRTEIVKIHGSLFAHYKNLAERCDNALRLLAELFDN